MCPERITMCDRTFFGIPCNFHRRCCCVFNSMITRSGLNQCVRFAGTCALCSSLHLQSAEMKKNFQSEQRKNNRFLLPLSYFLSCIGNLCVKMKSRNAFDNKRTRSNPGSDNESRKRYNSTNICRKAMSETLCTGY